MTKSRIAFAVLSIIGCIATVVGHEILAIWQTALILSFFLAILLISYTPKRFGRYFGKYIAVAGLSFLSISALDCFIGGSYSHEYLIRLIFLWLSFGFVSFLYLFCDIPPHKLTKLKPSKTIDSTR